jgi:hypothetical protein
MENLLNIVAAIFAFTAAVFWFRSAWGKLPPMVAYWDQAPANDPLYMAIKFSSRMNTVAAVLSGVSAFCMGLTPLVRYL